MSFRVSSRLMSGNVHCELENADNNIQGLKLYVCLMLHICRIRKDAEPRVVLAWPFIYMKQHVETSKLSPKQQLGTCTLFADITFHVFWVPKQFSVSPQLPFWCQGPFYFCCQTLMCSLGHTRWNTYNALCSPNGERDKVKMDFFLFIWQVTVMLIYDGATLNLPFHMLPVWVYSLRVCLAIGVGLFLNFSKSIWALKSVDRVV